MPNFEVSRYTSRSRELCFLKEFHEWFPEQQSAPFIGLNGGHTVRGEVMRLFKDTELNHGGGTFQNLLVSIDMDFAMTGREKI